MMEEEQQSNLDLTSFADHETVSAIASRSFWMEVWRRFRRHTMGMIAARYLLFVVIIALLADFLANDKPLICKRNDTIEFPIVQDYLIDLHLYKRETALLHADWKTLDYQWALWPLVRYQAHTIDYNNQTLHGPFSQQKISTWRDRHFLGTSRDGRDVLSGLIHGSRISLTIGLVAMGIAGLIGIILGAVAGYYGDTRWRLSTGGIIFGLLGIVLGYFYGFQVRMPVLKAALASGALNFLFQLGLSFLILIAVVWIMIQLSRPLKRIAFLGRKRAIWLDVLLSRIIEVFSTIPALLLIITIMSMVEKKNIYFVMVIFGLLGWTNVARFMRAEMLRTRSMEFIESARAMGYSEMRILFRHAIPNSITSVTVILTFGIAGAIALEAVLSFLGIGVPDDVVTWGGMLRDARSSHSAWWLTVFPGIAIFFTITSLNLLGEALRDVIDPKLRHE